MTNTQIKEGFERIAVDLREKALYDAAKALIHERRTDDTEGYKRYWAAIGTLEGAVANYERAMTKADRTPEPREPQEGEVITCVGADGVRRTLGETVRKFRSEISECSHDGLRFAAYVSSSDFRVFALIGDRQLYVYREASGIPAKSNGIQVSGPWVRRLVEFQRKLEHKIECPTPDSEIEWFRENWSG